MTAFLLVLALIVVLVAIANRIGVAYPIVLLLGGIAIGYIPGAPIVTLPPDLVLMVFLPPLLYWESVTAPESEFRASAWWIFQLAFGLVVITTAAVAAVAHALVPALGWGVAFVLGAIVSSTDEVAFAPIAERLRVPRHVIATIEGESLVNDATSLLLYAVAVAAVVTGTFSWQHAVGQWLISIVGALLIGVAAGSIAVIAWHFIKDTMLQVVISLTLPYLAYLPAQHWGMSGVLAVVTTGLFVNRFTPTVIMPSARERATGFWVTIVFVTNAIIFVLVGMQLPSILARLTGFSPLTLIGYGVAVSLTVIAVRFVWVFAQALLPVTNEPEHVAGKADWSHVVVLAWAGFRGGVSLAAALAIPFETALGPFPQRDLLIFLTFCVLVATLIGQGGTLGLLIRWLRITDDGASANEERIALAQTSRAALARIEQLEREGSASPGLTAWLRKRFQTRRREFDQADRPVGAGATRATEDRRKLESQIVDAQRAELIRLRDKGKIDNTVLRRIQRLLDLESEQLELLSSAGHADVDGE
jgi:monovalent cation/hydrogen antiporter